MRGDGGVAGEGRVVGLPKFHSWGKSVMPLTQIGCPTLPLACALNYFNYIGLWSDCTCYSLCLQQMIYP